MSSLKEETKLFLDSIRELTNAQRRNKEDFTLCMSSELGKMEDERRAELNEDLKHLAKVGGVGGVLVFIFFFPSPSAFNTGCGDH